MLQYPKVIYKITCNPTGKSYIGSTRDFPARVNTHFSQLRRGTHPVEDLQLDFDKYAPDFSYELIGVINEPKDNIKEYLAIEQLKTFDRRYGYNYKDINFKRIMGAPRCKFFNLEHEMQRQKITTEKLADGIGISEQTLINKLIGRHPLSFEQAIKIKRFLDVDTPLEELFDTEGN